MACGCNKKWRELEYVKKLAIRFCKVTKSNVIIYSKRDRNGYVVYNFCPLEIKPSNVVETIKYEDYSYKD